MKMIEAKWIRRVRGVFLLAIVMKARDINCIVETKKLIIRRNVVFYESSY